jgi:hypothetical protein
LQSTSGKLGISGIRGEALTLVPMQIPRQRTKAIKALTVNWRIRDGPFLITTSFMMRPGERTPELLGKIIGI